MKKFLVLSDLELTEIFFRQNFKENYQIHFLKQVDDNLFASENFDYIFIDMLVLKGFSTDTYGKQFFKQKLAPFWNKFPSARILIMTEPQNTREAVEVIKAGADNYVTYPLIFEEVKFIIDMEFENIREMGEYRFLKDQFWNASAPFFFESHNTHMQGVLEKIKAVASTKSTVLLTGETGTGKSVLAKMIHRHSNRRQDRFISVHCGAISESLIESELFGHEKGSFTGAVKRKLGKFEIAHEGTIFLDEVGTITSQVQISLLQVIQERCFQRVGGEEDIGVDVRIIAATNHDLATLVKEGKFREDLFYRLNVFPIELPPLRERIEDIPYLVDVFLQRLNKTHLKDIHGIQDNALKALQSYSWPGNIRELENLLERAYILESSKILTRGSFPKEIANYPEASIASVNADHTLKLSQTRQMAIEVVESNYLKELLSKTKGSIKKAAEIADVTPRQLHKLISKYGINRKQFF